MDRPTKAEAIRRLTRELPLEDQGTVESVALSMQDRLRKKSGRTYGMGEDSARILVHALAKFLKERDITEEDLGDFLEARDYYRSIGQSNGGRYGV